VQRGGSLRQLSPGLNIFQQTESYLSTGESRKFHCIRSTKHRRGVSAGAMLGTRCAGPNCQGRPGRPCTGLRTIRPGPRLLIGVVSVRCCGRCLRGDAPCDCRGGCGDGFVSFLPTQRINKNLRAVADADIGAAESLIDQIVSRAAAVAERLRNKQQQQRHGGSFMRRLPRGIASICQRAARHGRGGASQIAGRIQGGHAGTRAANVAQAIRLSNRRLASADSLQKLVERYIGGSGSH
jgi:hypothetical protein